MHTAAHQTQIKLTPIAPTMTDPTPFLSTDIALPDVPDEDDTPSRKRRADPGSFIAVLEALQIGETATKCLNLKLCWLTDGSDELVEKRRALHNSVSPQVAKLAKRTGRQFKVEVVDVFASGSVRLFLVAFVTRIA